MTARMSVLHAGDLPEAELCALRLDGDLFALGGALSPIDEIDSPALRAASLRRLGGSRLIAERLTAAWVWGAIDRAPARPQLCSRLDSRYRPWVEEPIEHREAALGEDEVTVLGGMPVTVPDRTLLDLARMPCDDEPSVLDAMRRLAEQGLVDGARSLADVLARPRLPHSRRMIDRLQRVVTG